MPKVPDSSIAAAVADSVIQTVKLPRATGDTTVRRFDHLIGIGVSAALADPTVLW